MIEETDRPGLDDAPAPRPIDELRVLHKTSTTLAAFVIGPQGVQMEVRIEGVTFDTLEGAALRAIKFENALIQEGLVPVPQPEPVVVQGAGVGDARPAGTGAVEIPSENGAPPKCSLHGPMKWVEGNNDKGHYEFWSCSHKNADGKYCKPRKA